MIFCILSDYQIGVEVYLFTKVWNGTKQIHYFTLSSVHIKNFQKSLNDFRICTYFMTRGDLLLPDLRVLSQEPDSISSVHNCWYTWDPFCKVRHIVLEQHKVQVAKEYITLHLWNALNSCSKVYITTNKLLLVTSILFWERCLQLCLPYWGIYCIDTSLSHPTSTKRCWFSLGVLSKLFLQEAWAALTHSLSNSIYAKEKQLLQAAPGPQEHRSLPCFTAGPIQYTDEEWPFWCLFASPLPACTHPSHLVGYLQAEFYQAGTISHLAFVHVPFKRVPTHAWVCYLRKQYH